jgi:SAM-dependent methyltransferase
MCPVEDSSSLRDPAVTGNTLRIRQETYDRYSVPKIDYASWVLTRIAWRGDEQVLDVGCGPGMYYPVLMERWPGIRYHGADYSVEMLQSHPAEHGLTQADAQTLPYADGTFDVVMANHMLFHVADQDRAISEFRRVLKPDGVLVTATNSLHTMPEFQALMRRAMVLLGAGGKGQSQPPPLPHQSFALENGTRQLAHHFFAVVRYDLPTALVFPSLDPVMSFLESTRDLREAQLPAGVSWDDMMLVMREQIVALLGHFGELVINKISGVLIASDQGGFIQGYVERSNNGHHGE